MYGGTGGDYGWDDRGDDVFYLGAGPDTAVAIHGIDAIYAGPGIDTCLSTFDEMPGDVIDGGEGIQDQYDADAGDTVMNVESGPQVCGC
jgi:hypothetical protein